MHLLSKCFFCNPKLYLPVTSFFTSVISRVWQSHRKCELRPWHGLSHLALAASDTHAVLHSPGSGHTKSSLRLLLWFFLPPNLFCLLAFCLPSYTQTLPLASPQFSVSLFPCWLPSLPYRAASHSPHMPWIFSFGCMCFVLSPICNIFLWISAWYMH